MTTSRDQRRDADAEHVPILRRFDALAAFYGTGRKLTATGHPTLADARRLVEALELEERLDPAIGTRALTIRSAAELPELCFTIAWALRSGALRKQHGRLVATQSWSKASAGERRQRAVQALVALGPLAAVFEGSLYGYGVLAAAFDESFPSLLLRLGDAPLDLASGADELTEYLDDTYSFSGWWAEQGRIATEARRALVEYGRLLGLAGLAALEDHAGSVADAATIVPSPGARQVIGRLELPKGAPAVYRTAGASSTSVHELSVILDETEPAIWRRIVVPSGVSLAALHEVLQVAMGWSDSHLHSFDIAGVTYGPDDSDDWSVGVADERRHRLEDLTGRGDRFSYLYDFGDSWEHTLEVLDVRPTGDEEAPRCLDGALACPPEDCGGVPGYYHLLEVLADPNDEEHAEVREWAGDDYDPQRFDTAEVDRALRRLGRVTAGS